MEKPKVIHVLYAGLGGHGSVVFPLLESSFGDQFENVLVFYGVEETRQEYVMKSEKLALVYYGILKKPKQYLKPFYLFKKILKNEKPNYIIIHSSELIIPAVRYAKKRDCTVIYAEHEPNHTKTRLEKYLTNFAKNHVAKIICLNQSYVDSLNFKSDKVVIIPNGVNHNIYKEKKVNTNKILGIAARITDTKDHHNLLIAFKKALETNPNLELKIAGDGNLKKQISEEAIKLGIHFKITSTGLLNEQELVEFYQSLDVYVHATKSETLSTAILQAMACGLPVITADIENNALLIQDDQTGWLYQDQNPLDLADKINYVIAHPAAASRVGQAARAHVISNYSVAHMAKLYTNLLSEEKQQ